MDLHTDLLRARARALHTRADQLRGLAEDLTRAVDGLWWEGATGDRLREVVAARVHLLHRAADSHDHAGDELTRHAGHVEEAARDLRSAAVHELVTLAAHAHSAVEALA